MSAVLPDGLALLICRKCNKPCLLTFESEGEQLPEACPWVKWNHETPNWEVIKL